MLNHLASPANLAGFSVSNTWGQGPFRHGVDPSSKDESSQVRSQPNWGQSQPDSKNGWTQKRGPATRELRRLETDPRSRLFRIRPELIYTELVLPEPDNSLSCAFTCPTPTCSGNVPSAAASAAGMLRLRASAARPPQGATMAPSLTSVRLRFSDRNHR